MKTALIIAPHPDDAEIAMAGTIVKMVHDGWNVIIIDLTNGEPTPHGSTEIRTKETQQATRILGIKKRICLNLPNRRIGNTIENRGKIAELIRLNKPDILFTPFQIDWHPDHCAATELVQAARFEAKYHETDLKGTPHWTGKLIFYISQHRFQYPQPTFVIDISDTWQEKINAVKCYKSQIKNASPSSPANLLNKTVTIAKFFGLTINSAYGEPFIADQPLALKPESLLNS